MTKRAKKAWIITGSVTGGLVFVCLVLLLALQIGYMGESKNASVWMPPYAKEDIAPVLNQKELAEEDYDFLYRQTGLTKIGIDRAREKGPDGLRRIEAIHDDYFEEYTVESTPFGPWMNRDYIDGRVATSYLEDGDIFVTSSNHFSMVRVGHAGLVIDGEHNRIAQAIGYGYTSFIGTLGDFNDKMNFMILRPKVDDETKALACAYAKEKLIGLPYAAFRGTDMDISTTQCAHLVWRAYAEFGVDIVDHDEWLVLPRHLAQSSKMEVVQVFGFDPVALWPK